MLSEFVNVPLAFIEGLALIFSPCILPILPIVLSGSLTGSKARPLGIVTGFVVSFALFTLFSRAMVTSLNINPDHIRDFSLIVLILLGMVMLSARLSERFNLFAQSLAQVGSSWQFANNQEGGFWGGVIFGCLVGLIWAPCAGPVLAAVIVQVVLQQSHWVSVLTVIAFALGVGLPMLMIALIGRQVLSHVNFLRGHSQLIQAFLGVIIIVAAVWIYYEEVMAGQTVKRCERNDVKATQLINGLDIPYRAPEITGISDWINSPPLTLASLRGKVVLIDFWTYSCINCIRTLPYLKDWYAKYRDQGLVIIGIHTPEFEFERDINNVKAAVEKQGILYPVALDSQFATWLAFSNRYWPAHYLINKNGIVVYTHFGEGAYDVTENNIRFLLGIDSQVQTQSATVSADGAQSPETYFGYTRADNYHGNEAIAKDHIAMYSYPAALGQDQWALKGKWKVSAEYIQAEGPGAAVKFEFNAKYIYAVLGNAGLPVNVTTTLNGKIKDKNILVDKYQLYTIASLPQTESGEVELVADTIGLRLYTFTFGS